MNQKRVARIMREDSLLCLRRKKFVTTTDLRHGLPVYPNLLVSELGMVPLSRLIAPTRGGKGRPTKDPQALATAFLAKAVLGLKNTRQLLDRLQVDRTLRSLCGWNSAEAVPTNPPSRALSPSLLKANCHCICMKR